MTSISRLFLTLLLFFTGLLISPLQHELTAQDYFLDSYKTALKKAKQSDKLIFISYIDYLNQPKIISYEWYQLFMEHDVKLFMDSLFICVKADDPIKKISNQRKEYSSLRYVNFTVIRSDGSTVKNFYNLTLNKKHFISELNNITKIDSLYTFYDEGYSQLKNDPVFLVDYYEFLKSNNNTEKSDKIAKRILLRFKRKSSKDIMKVVLDRIFHESNKRYVLRKKKLFIDTLGKTCVYNALYEDYKRRFHGGYLRSSKTDVHKIKNDFIHLFEIDDYADYYYTFLLKLSLFKSDLILEQDLYNALTKKLKTDPCFLQSKLYYDLLLEFIFKIDNPIKLKTLKEGFSSQINNQNVRIDYYDLKAFIEYKLGDEEAAIRTIQQANSISVMNNKRPFNSTLSKLIALDRETIIPTN